MTNVVTLKAQHVSDFDRFWSVYPRRVAKKAARAAFEKAQRDLDWPGIEAVLEAVDAYRNHKPDYCDYCHPSTWLNQGRWDDEYGDGPKETMRDATPEEAAAYYREQGRDRLAERCFDAEPPSWLAFKVPVGWTP